MKMANTMNKFIMALILSAAFAAQAKQIENPDANTLWMEDGKEIELSKGPGFKKWMALPGKRVLEFTSKQDGKSFSLLAKDAAGRKTLTRVKLSKEYPYLTFRITGFDLLQGYRNWTFGVDGLMLTSQVTAPQKGIYVFDLFRNASEKGAAQKAAYLQIWLYNLRMDLDYIKLVKKPAYAVRVECADPEIKPGSKVKFIAELEKEAEDVSVTLTTNGNPRPVQVNNTVKIQLKPTDKTQKIWTAEVEIKKIGIRKALPRHRIFMKMDVLGGDLDEPVWVGLPYAIAP